MSDERRSTPETPQVTTPGWDRLMAVVVSDEAWPADLVRAACDPADFEVRHLPRDAQAFLRIARLAPSVIAVDISGGAREPFDLLRALQSQPETSATPVLALAPAPDPLLRAAAFAAGVEDVSHRGTDPEELRSRMRTLGRLATATSRSLQAEADLQRTRERLRERDRDLEDTRHLIDSMRSDLQADNRTQRTRVDGMVQVGLELNKVQDFHVLMDRILSDARRLINADAGTVYLREGKVLRFAYAQNDTLARQSTEAPRFSSLSIAVSDHSIAGWVGSSGETVNVQDAYAIEPSAPFRFDPTFDRLTGYRTRSVLAMPLRTSQGRSVGVLQLLNAVDERGMPRERFRESDQALLTHFASMATVAIERTQLIDSIIMRMLGMVKTRDPIETGQHIERVAGISTAIFEEWARRRGLEGPAFERQRDRLRIAAKLHDVGKIGISDALLKKGGKLTPEEYELMKQHVTIGARFFLDHPTEFDDAARDVVLSHHERWDGTGYPGQLDPQTGLSIPGTGKRGESIPLFARIVGLADVFDALSSTRTYKDAWPERQVLDTIRGKSGTHFDPELVEIFFARLDAVRDLRDANPE